MTAHPVTPRVITKISTDELRLDPRNPRLYNGKSFNDNSEEHELVKALSDHADLDELIKSISENGYLSIEPLVIIKYKGDDKFTVLEGNRRLAALKILKSPELAKKCRIVIPK
ncbi:ParB/Srx family N-terminal domain-containing protein, partial [Asticcacaulis benevestitus]|uniref:ParB/Srx family N-terminal domain-containing protein n=1 Tax=Asticcacaulis benevestitus TaxID=347481 RepID=UPI00138B0F62